ncbi:hypothetical protein AB1484_22135 [Parafrankia sp. FMc6]|nr:hypothetical protein [Parafrankia sp. Ea1.12]
MVETFPELMCSSLAEPDGEPGRWGGGRPDYRTDAIGRNAPIASDRSS